MNWAKNPQKQSNEEGIFCKHRETAKNVDSYSPDTIVRFYGGCGAQEEHASKNKKYKQVVVDLPGYPPKKEQHLYYRTSGMDLGLKPNAGHLPARYHPRNNSFTLSLQGFGNYTDSHFTTELDHCQHTQL